MQAPKPNEYFRVSLANIAKHGEKQGDDFADARSSSSTARS